MSAGSLINFGEFLYITLHAEKWRELKSSIISNTTLAKNINSRSSENIIGKKTFIFYKCISLYKSRFTQNKETVIFISKGDIANIPDQYKNGILWKMGLYFFSRSTNMSSLKSGQMANM